MSNPSFFFGIFKRLQVCDTSMPLGAGHFAPPGSSGSSGGLSGGFCLWYPSHPNGIQGKILASADLGNQPPLVNTKTPSDSPLSVILNHCLSTPACQSVLTVQAGPSGLQWPIMPNYCCVTGASNNPGWSEFGAEAVAALDTWIMNGQHSDEPRGELYYTTLNDVSSLPGLFPSLTKSSHTSILFMCSEPGDNGRRPNDGGPGDSTIPPIENYWATSLIFLMDQMTGEPQPDNGVLHFGAANIEYNLGAAIGNCGSIGAGRYAYPAQPRITVEGWAMPSNTGFGPAVQLPPLSNLASNARTLEYEQYFLAENFRDVVGFRFNVNSVFNGLVQALMKPPLNMTQAAAEQWLEGGHACVQVFVTGGETPNLFPPHPPKTGVGSDPQTDRHIAQKNLGQFQPPPGAKQWIKWTNFIVAQAPLGGAGVNRLQIRHESLPGGFNFLLATPTKTFDDYVRKTDDLEGFEIARGVTAPFPDAVILRQRTPGSLLEIASHEREPLLRLSLGLDYNSAAPFAGRVGSVSVVHLFGEDKVFGGFTIEIVPADERGPRA